MTAPADNPTGICKTPNCHNATTAHYRTCAPCRRWRTRLMVVSRYGGACCCCGESELGFLTLDHVDGGGKTHREQIFASGRGDLWVWAYRNGYPAFLRLLCFNCNSGRARNGGICPHEQPYRPPGVISVQERLNDEQRAVIVARFASGERGVDIAASLGLSKQTVSVVVCNARRAGAAV